MRQTPNWSLNQTRRDPQHAPSMNTIAVRQAVLAPVDEYASNTTLGHCITVAP